MLLESTLESQDFKLHEINERAPTGDNIAQILPSLGAKAIKMASESAPAEFNSNTDFSSAVDRLGSRQSHEMLKERMEPFKQQVKQPPKTTHSKIQSTTTKASGTARISKKEQGAKGGKESLLKKHQALSMRHML